MSNENHFSPRLLVAAAKVKDSIDHTFCLVTAQPQADNEKVINDLDHQEWKNAEIFAREFKVNRKELQSAFKYCNNDKGINEYQAERKIEAACILLANGEMNIKEIAAELDYHQDYFSYIFKKQKGVTPTEWQKKEWERKLS